ncbi:MAG: DUF882 domain-containing protein [Deltaproteobacteria bacterium]
MFQNTDQMYRRLFLKTLLFSGITACLPNISSALADNADNDERTLNLYHPKTKECLTSTYWEKGDYVKDALVDIDYIMRDQHSDKIKQIDTKLLDLLFRIQTEIAIAEPLHIMSGYRTPETNEYLRKQGVKISNNSFHEKGKAVDIRLPSIKTSLLRRTAYRQKNGGVGFYPNQRFVHVDVGPIRYWTKY